MARYDFDPGDLPHLDDDEPTVRAFPAVEFTIPRTTPELFAIIYGPTPQEAGTMTDQTTPELQAANVEHAVEAIERLAGAAFAAISRDQDAALAVIQAPTAEVEHVSPTELRKIIFDALSTQHPGVGREHLGADADAVVKAILEVQS
jgi:hypothetical protein